MRLLVRHLRRPLRRRMVQQTGADNRMTSTAGANQRSPPTVISCV
eukprot:CAMPEP_0204489640 /NCGR_PEP_ID=MMETSP0471-20130131/72717_1 /ASSEMBLY_ACC=CAM_ASM_000602 /TAXON_ID=2969 /ORGANISM="Oxyrrhis marina" /LENGTH=44 /DNA_ID= /DNA_START= /DNA_END= /DNA_ORIENTATION=